MDATRHGVCLGVQGAQNADYWDRGIARYIVEHARALVAIAPELVHTIRASPDLAFPPSLVDLLPSGRVRRTDAPPVDARGAMPAIYHVMSPLEWGHPIDVIWPAWARDPALPLVVTLYDLIPRLFPDKYSRRAHERIAYDARLELVRRADHVLAISAHTAADAERELGVPADRITVIDAAASTSFADLWPRPQHAEEHVRATFPGIRGSFAFYVGGMDERKNMPRLIEAWSLVASDVRATTQLVITCGLRPEQVAELERHAARHGLRREDVVLTGRVSDRDLAALYRSCRLFVFASLYEGSGLPILEAMTAEAPVVAARTSTGPEILGSDEGTFDPANAADMAAVIEQTLRAPARLEAYRERSRSRVREYSWERVARLSIGAYETTLARRRKVVRRRRPATPRIALLIPARTPARPADSAYARLAMVLGERAHVDVIHDEGGQANGAVGEPLYELRRLRGLYDRTIHVIGDEPAHQLAYEALVRSPGGVVLLEDVRLDRFYCWYASRAGGRLWMRRQLEQQYGELVPGWIAIRDAPTPEECETYGLFFTREIQRLAAQVVAPAVLSGEVLHVDRRGEDFGARVAVAAPVAPSRPTTRASAGADIVAVEPCGSPAAALLIAALALLRERRPGVRLRLVGRGSASERENLRATASVLGIAEAVAFDGPRLDAGEPWLDGAGVVAIPSASLDVDRIALAQEALAAGVPVVAADMGWVTQGGAFFAVPAHPSAAQVAEAAAAALEGKVTDLQPTAEGADAQRWIELLGL
jgi:glycosyltransferase involved in cell wall biosynthesis